MEGSALETLWFLCGCFRVQVEMLVWPVFMDPKVLLVFPWVSIDVFKSYFLVRPLRIWIHLMLSLMSFSGFLRSCRSIRNDRPARKASELQPQQISSSAYKKCAYYNICLNFAQFTFDFSQGPRGLKGSRGEMVRSVVWYSHGCLVWSRIRVLHIYHQRTHFPLFSV